MADVIDFFWPNEPGKIIFITNIIDASKLESNKEENITQHLHELFSEFGLVCEVKVVKNESSAIESLNKNHNLEEVSFYALVKFYTKSSAQQAITKSFHYNGFLLKVKPSSFQASLSCKNLYYRKSVELANHFFGFNGWSSKITKFHKHNDVMQGKISITCAVLVNVFQGHVQSQGQVTAVETYSSLESKIVSFMKAKNQAYRLALENAFSKLLIVLLKNGKVSVHFNHNLETVSPSEDDVMESELDFNPGSYDGIPLLKVNNCEDYAKDDDEEEDGSSIEAILNEVLLFDYTL